MKTTHTLLIMVGLILFGMFSSECLGDEMMDKLVEKAGNVPVLLDEGANRFHELDCKRLGGNTDGLERMTLAEAVATGAIPCGRCTRRLKRQYKVYPTPKKVNKDWRKINEKQTGMDYWPKRGRRARIRRDREAKKNPVKYDPDTTVYCDALWMRVHAPDCPMLILKDKKKTMTLEQADKEGWRIGECGQSGRGNCCFKGYARKHPRKKLPGDIIFFGNYQPGGKKHLAGCHRFWMSGTEKRHTLKWWIEHGFENICPHDRERGPSLTTVSEKGMKILRSRRGKPFTPPPGWQPKPFFMDKLPSKKQLEMLVQRVLSGGSAIQELPFDNPVASVEQFVTMRFFFPVKQWLDLYQVYRGTGDQRVLDLLLKSARHYNKLSKEYSSAAQLKARDPEGISYMLSMALCARIKLQLARKYPSKVSKGDLLEAEDFLKTMVAVLKPTCEGEDDLDPKMGIPKKLAADFRNRAFNRALNGIGTIAMATVALEDLQALKKTKTYQPTIDRYRKVVQEYVKHYRSWGHMCDKVPAGKAFFYPYSPRESKTPKMKNGCRVYHRAEDPGHYSHALQGLLFIYEATPELGVDDDFMTAVANAIYYHSRTGGGQIRCPANSKKPKGKGGTGRNRFYPLEAFNDNIIANERSGYSHRTYTLRAMYVKALREDRSLIHLGEKQ